MKTTKTVIENLKRKIDERKSQIGNMYNEYHYRYAIKQTVDEKVGVEPTYLDIKNLPDVGLN